MVDIDETVCLHHCVNAGEFKVIYHSRITRLNKHQININLLDKLYRLNYALIFWSATGAEWAELVCKAFDIDYMASLYLTKPRYYIDDLPCQAWMGERIYKDPVTGEEK